jgi:[ribosomal protein S5]-alanine N-acetyltransferase
MNFKGKWLHGDVKYFICSYIYSMIINNNPFPVLTTDRLILRRLDMGDADNLFQQRSNAEVNRYLIRPVPVAIEEVYAYVKKIDGLLADNKSFYWVLCLKTDNKLIGTICLWNFEFEKDMADLGYELSPEFQGMGLMQEAAEKVIDYGFDVVGIKTLLGVTDPGNERSAALLKRNGFKEDTEYKYVSKDEVGNDMVYFLVR